MFLVFALNGFLMASLIARVPDVRSGLDLGNGALGLLLLCIAFGSVLALPSRAGSRVALQVYDREAFAWVTAARGRLDARSRATIEFDAAAPRSHVRAVVLGRGGWSDGASRPLVVTQ